MTIKMYHMGNLSRNLHRYEQVEDPMGLSVYKVGNLIRSVHTFHIHKYIKLNLPQATKKVCIQLATLH